MPTPTISDKDRDLIDGLVKIGQPQAAAAFMERVSQKHEVGPFQDIDHVVNGLEMSWFRPEQWQNAAAQETFSVYGHTDRKVEEGQRVAVEMQKTFGLFEVASVNRPGDPRDLYFAELKPLEQVLKATMETVWKAEAEAPEEQNDTADAEASEDHGVQPE